MIIIWIILIAWGIWLLAPIIGKWLMKRVQKSVQDRMFRSMGLNPDDFREKKSSRRKGGEERDTRREGDATAVRHRKIIPEGYGEYVQFTVLAITGKEPWLDTSASPVFVHYSEAQLTDIKWVEIR